MATTAINNPADYRLSAQLSLTSNGDGAKTAKVSLVARSGDPIDICGMGMVVHDFAGMTSKSRIPLDYEHDEPIGYLNHFDTSSGDLVCTGVIALIGEEATELYQKMQALIPYEASIQFDDDCLLEFIPEGYTVSVNNRNLTGPLIVVREWELDAVAICKLGRDDATSSELLNLSKEKSEPLKGFFVRFAKSNHMGKNTMTKETTKVQAEPSATTVETKVEAKAVEAVAKVEVTTLSTVSAEAVKAVEAIVQTDEVKEDDVATAVEAVPVTTLSEPKPVDPRSEFKSFVNAFGAEKASNYFAEGMSFEVALAKFASDMKTENDSLKKKLSAIDRGGPKPVAFSDASVRDEQAKPKGMLSVISRVSGPVTPHKK